MVGHQIYDQVLDRRGLSTLRDGFLRIEAKAREATAGEAKTSVGQMIRGAPDADQRAFFGDVIRFFWSSFLPDLYVRRYGHAPLFLVQYCTIRRQAPIPDGAYIGWHLDANFYGFDVPMITAWVPLSDVGVTSPALEFCVAAHPNDAATIGARWMSVRQNDKGQRLVTDDTVADIAGRDCRVEPVRLKFGDCCVFDQTVLHRTQILPGALDDRVAIEFRIAARDRLPRDVTADSFDWILVSWRDDTTGQIRVEIASELAPRPSPLS